MSGQYARVGQRNIRDSPQHTPKKEKARKSPTSVHGHEQVAHNLTAVAKLYAGFPRREPQGTAAFSVKYGYSGTEENGVTSYMRLQTG